MMTLDLEAIRQAHPLPGVAGAVLKLSRAGNEFKACCPFHADRSPSFTIYDGGQRFQCFGCGAGGDVLDFVQRLHGVGLVEAANLLTGNSLPSIHLAAPPVADNAERVAEAKAIWRAAQPVAGSLAETYLRHRGITIPIPASIRFTTLPYGKSERVYPVLIAAVASADDKLIGIQRTYLRDDGKGKADVPKPKLSLGRVSGGAIRLAPAARELIVCEGLEDGLSLQEVVARATWVAAGASMLPAMIFPAGVEKVAVGGDADAAGRKAARKAAETFSSRGLSSRVFFPMAPHKDFNAELMEIRA